MEWLGLRRELPPHQPVVVDLPAMRPGEYDFHCGMNMLRGTIVVEALTLGGSGRVMPSRCVRLQGMHARDEGTHVSSTTPLRDDVGAGGPVPERAAEPAAILIALIARREELVAFVRRRVGDRALAEDLFQDALLRAVDKLPALRSREAIVPWFYRMLRNAIVDHRRRRASAARAARELAAEVQAHAAGSDTRGAPCRCVSTIVGTLKPEHAEALRRIEVDGIAVKDYAAEAGITAGHAGVRVFRARDALRKRVHASCGACASRGCVDCTCGAAR